LSITGKINTGSDWVASMLFNVFLWPIAVVVIVIVFFAVAVDELVQWFKAVIHRFVAKTKRGVGHD
jgi:hypothetical protein